MKQRKIFRFKRNSSVGAVDAYEDKRFLKNCFIDTGDIDVLCDTSRPECILLGRTGSGKTALIERLLSTHERTIKIEPENLALTYLANNEAIKFYIDIGVDLDLFFRLLWRHILCVEVIKEHFDINTLEKQNIFIEYLKKLVPARKTREKAKEYLLNWSDTFWKDTDFRVKEFTSKLEQELTSATQAQVAVAIPGASGSIGLNPKTATKLTEEQKSEIVRLGQPIVEKRQMGEMTEVMKLLEEELLNNKQKYYYITIDRIDERWVNEKFKYQLIRALLETIRDFNNRLTNVKVILALRDDLAGRVFRKTRSAGDQEEKYTSLYLNLLWRNEDLIKMLEIRLNQLIEEQYTKQSVNLHDILPMGIYGISGVDYFLSRTMQTPRDAIMLFNECILKSEGKGIVDKGSLVVAESSYSDKRLNALADEWSADYPSLVNIVLILKKLDSSFSLNTSIINLFKDRLLDYLANSNNSSDEFYQVVNDSLYEKNKPIQVIYKLIKILYKVGVIGVQSDLDSSIYWSYRGDKITEAEFDDKTHFHIHPSLWRKLGIKNLSQ